MIALYILGGLLLLIGLVLISPIAVRIRGREDYNIELGWLFLRFRLYPKKPDKHPGKTKKEKKPSETGKAVKTYLTDLFREKGTKGALRELWDIAKTVLRPLVPFFGRAKVDCKEFSLAVAGKDAAATALEYGAANALVYNTLAFLRERVTFRRLSVAITPAFTATGTTLALDLRIRWRVWHLVSLAWTLLRLFIHKFSRSALPKPTKGGSDHGGKQQSVADH